jgi:IS5 family transposase
MNKQKTFTGMEYAQRKRTGRREKFPDAPDAAALLKFRHLSGEHAPRKEPFRPLNCIPEAKGKIRRGGTIADTTIIEAPSPAENSAKIREPEIKPARKGNQQHSGTKARIGADAGAGMARGAGATARMSMTWRRRRSLSGLTMIS